MRVGIAGIGFMGWIHWLAYQQVEGVEVAAIATRDAAKRQGDWTAISGNFGPPGERVDLSGVQVYDDWQQLVQDDSLDLIDVCLPPHLHEQICIQALQQGRHVFCEKPLALTAEECQRIAGAAESTSRQLLVGQVLPFFPEYAEVYRRVVEQGEFGKCLGGHFKRIIDDPSWLPDFFDPQRVGGPLIDLHVHDAHFIRLLFGGLPQAVTSRGRLRGATAEYCGTLMHFSDPEIVVTAQCGVIHQTGRPFTHGFEIHCQLATLLFDFSVIDGEPVTSVPLTILHGDGGVERPPIQGDPVQSFVAEITEVAASVRSGQPSPILSGSLASDAIRLCQAQADSLREQRTVSL